MITKTYYTLEKNDKDFYFKIMQDKKMSLRALAKKLNYSASYLSAVFNGKKGINQEILIKITSAIVENGI